MRFFYLKSSLVFINAAFIVTTGCSPEFTTDDPANGTSTTSTIEANCGGCDTPPESYCADSINLLAYNPIGTCANNTCSYTLTRIVCEEGCANNACIGNDPCNGIYCDDAPATACTDSDTLRTYSGNGTCSAGNCDYEYTETTCQTSCVDAACTGNDPCDGISCNDPPESSCTNSNTLRTYSSSGSCENADCSYSYTDTQCDYACSNGACTDPCDGITCNDAQPNSCIDENTLRTYASSGTCDNGSCSYTYTDSTCEFGCENGECADGFATQVVAGHYYTCALLGNGSIRCWGYNYDAQCGYGNTKSYGDNEAPSTSSYVSLGDSALQIAASRYHTCALLSSGDVQCWGTNDKGQLGHGNTSTIGDDEVPSSVANVDLGGTAIQIAVGGEHSCALMTNGNIRCWGNNWYGQLGYGTDDTYGDDDYDTPAQIGDIDLGGSAKQITVGGEHTCALLTNGSVRCWGGGYYGQLGYGDEYSYGGYPGETPSQLPDVSLGEIATQIAAGDSHTCALLSSGNIICWGNNDYGQLGYGNLNAVGDDEAPSTVGTINLGDTATAIAAGGNNTCALLSSGAVRCWGVNNDGQLGYANTNKVGDNESPSSAGDINIGASATAITINGSSTDGHACVIVSDGHIRCWGYNGYGQLGYGNTSNIGDNETPASAGNAKIF